MALAVSGASMAVLRSGETAYMDIYFSDNGSKEDVFSLVEGTDYTDAFDQNGDATKFLNNAANSINAYGMVGDVKCSVVARPSLDGTAITFISNNATSYTITFDEYEGTPYLLFDMVSGSSVLISNTASLSFTATPNTTYNSRFVLTTPYQVKTNTSGYATYSNSLDLTLVAGQTGDPKVCSATYTSVSDEEGLLTLHAEAGVPANTGVIIRGAASTTYTLVPATIAPFTSTNVLEASVEETTNSGALCMATIGGVCAFYEYTGAMISANKAYLPLSVLTEGGVAAPKRVRMVVEGTTALDANASASTKVEKIMVNGQVYILREGQRYDVMGQIVK